MAPPLLDRRATRRRWLGTAATVCGILCGRTLPLTAQAGATRPEMQIEPTSTPPLIDGRLDDLAWQRPALPTGEWRSYNPLHGNAIPQQTTVWLTYDRDNLYIAFKCDDPEPDKIKTSVSRRDNIWADDWVGLSLDALGTGQQSYHMMVNPSGVQLDAAEQRRRRRRHIGRLGLGQRRPPHRHRLRRRNPAATAEHPVQRRAEPPHGPPVLAAREPSRRVGRLAAARTRQVGLRAERLGHVRRHPAPPASRHHSQSGGIAATEPRHAVALVPVRRCRPMLDSARSSVWRRR